MSGFVSVALISVCLDFLASLCCHLDSLSFLGSSGFIGIALLSADLDSSDSLFYCLDPLA